MYNKRSVTIFILGLIFSLGSASAVYANTDEAQITVFVDGQQIHFADQHPVIVDGRTLVPIRDVFVSLGFDIEWNPDTGTATLTDPDYDVVIVQGRSNFTVNGRNITPDVPQQIINGRFMLPLRAVSEAVNVEVHWLADIQTVLITTPPPDYYTASIRRLLSRGYSHHEIAIMYTDMTFGAINQARQNQGIEPLNWNTVFLDALDADRIDNPTATSVSINTVRNFGWASRVLTVSFRQTDRQSISDALAAMLRSDGVESENHTDGVVLVSFDPENTANYIFFFSHELPWEASLLSRRSSIALQNRRQSTPERQEWTNEYLTMGGASDFELEVIRLVNEERANYGLRALTICHTLMLASRFYAQTMANLNTNLGHREGPYGGSFGTADSFGDRVVGTRAANGISGRWTPEGAVYGWMNSPGHRANILNRNITRMGTGFHLSESGVFGYQLFGGGSATAVPR